ncbi:DUF7927 domain-containing protein [Leucobacter sp. USHLN153]|uniref:DUF7927 domain-containing protein n=1 Tax=Leucobacter sp. USHLN153 TaxID=3081268 RepID=UPI003019E0B4
MALTNRVWSKRVLSVPVVVMLAAALAVPASLSMSSVASATAEDPATGTSVELQTDDSSKSVADESVEDTANAPDAANPISGGGGALNAVPDEVTDLADDSSNSPAKTDDDTSEDPATKPKEGVSKKQPSPLLNRGPLFEALAADAPTVVQPLEGAMATVVEPSFPHASLQSAQMISQNSQNAYVHQGESVLLNLKVNEGVTFYWDVFHPSGEKEMYQMTTAGAFVVKNPRSGVQTVVVEPKFAPGQSDGIVRFDFRASPVGNEANPAYNAGENWYTANVFVIPGSFPVGIGTLSYSDVSRLFDNRVRGRVFTLGSYILQSFTDRRDFTFWSLLYSGHLYEISTYKYMGMSSLVKTSSSGPGDPNVPDRCVSAYKSLRPTKAEQEICGTTFYQFFEKPASDLPNTATLNGRRVPLSPPVIQAATLEALPVSWQSSGGPGIPFRGSLSWQLPEAFTGSYVLQVDADGDGSYDGTTDRSISFNASFGSASVEYAFDGLDNEGRAIRHDTDVSARLYFDHLAEVHFTFWDVELLGGVTITRLNGDDPGSTIYWNDLDVTPVSSYAIPPPKLDGREGVDSAIADGVHGWFEAPAGRGSQETWGDQQLIDNWGYEALRVSTKVKPLTLPPDIQVQKQSSYDQVTGKVTYTVNVRNDGLGYFDEDTVAGIGLLARDQTNGVLDDATFNNDLAVTSKNPDVKGSYDPATGYVQVLLDKGASFGPGDTATVTYSVTVNTTKTGDATLLNYAEAANYDPGDPKFGCADDDGKPLLMVGSSSGWSKCSWTTDLVPVLSIEKSADKTELYGLNDVATYKVKVTNHGPGVLNGFNFGGTNGVNPVMVDDLAKVADDAQLVWTDTAGTVPENTFYEDGGKLYWHGTLAVGETRTLSYQAKVVKGTVNDYELNNTACLAENIVIAKDAKRCAEANLTRAGLAMAKTVDPASGEAVEPGEQVTYTLSFYNPGKALATVDTIDVLDGVLDDAIVNDDFVVKDGTITVTREASVTGENLVITGTVPAGKTATVTYTATVKAENEKKGDYELENVLLASPDIEPVCGEEGVFCVWNPLPHPTFSPTLPFTGTEGLMRLLVLGGAGVVVLLVVARRFTRRAS